MSDMNVVEKQPLTDEYLKKMDAYWRAANYLGAAQLYLLDNPLLREPLTMEHIKKKIVGHWGTVPGQNFVYVHLNRVIKKYDQDMILISGPGHGGNFFVANTYLEGTYSEIYPNIGEDMDGLKKLCKQFSFPGGISSHVAPETPGSINEGGELGYSLAHSFGAVFDNPDLVVACIVGDGEAETGPLATSWQCNKFLNAKNDGAVLPILHLNGYKISNPTVLARISHEELEHFFDGCGWKPYFVEGDDPMTMHRSMAEALDACMDEIKAIQKSAREDGDTTRHKWPMIVLRTPKGWTGPKEVDGKQIEGSFRAHQVPITMEKPEHLELLKNWLESYHPEELFDENGKLIPELKALAPTGDRRIGSNPHANGGKLLKDLRLPDFREYGIDVPKPGSVEAQDMIELGGFVRDIFKLNEESKNFRIFGPDETMSNRLGKVFEVTNRDWNNEKYDSDEFLAADGRVMDSMLSEHMCEGWLEVEKKYSKGEDIGYVGEVTDVDTTLLDSLLKDDFLPVICPIGYDDDFHAYNINADDAACAIARAVNAEKLAFLTDIEGVYKDFDDKDSLISELSTSEARTLLESGTIGGGMLPKLNNCIDAIEHGVSRVHILDGRIPHCLLLEIFTNKGVGTAILSDDAEKFFDSDK